MKKLMIFLNCLYLSLSLNVDALSWQEYWIKAVELCNEKNFADANDMFNAAVFNMEVENDTNHPYVYVDRARLNLLLGNYESALYDLNKALSNQKITTKEKSRALVSRIVARSRLGIQEGILEDLNLFGEIAQDKPILEKTEEFIIIRNAPDCPCYRDLMTCYFIHNGMCQSKNDIKVLNPNIWIIKRSCKCDNNNSSASQISSEKCDACGIELKFENTPGKIADCKIWCDRLAVVASGWCAHTFSTFRCQTACIWAVNEIKLGCYWCCEGAGFYKRCVEPFSDVAKYIKEPCDPAWD